MIKALKKESARSPVAGPVASHPTPRTPVAAAATNGAHTTAAPASPTGSAA
jgi:hypothetical protein